MEDTDPATVCAIDFTTVLPEGTKEIVPRAEALTVWWKAFQKTGFLRKNPHCSVVEEESSCAAGILRIAGIQAGDAAATAAVEQKIRSSMKKIQVEDLGRLQASDLLASIPQEDPQGRGLQDLRDTEKKLSVKVVFDTIGEHVYLVGDAKKLEKKVFAIRNMISHYHWRLSGTEMSKKS